MAIKGFQPTSLIDYPDKICSVIFISKCNFRCGYCHNKDLVLDNVHGACKASEHLSEMWNISEHDHESLIHDII